MINNLNDVPAINIPSHAAVQTVTEHRSQREQHLAKQLAGERGRPSRAVETRRELDQIRTDDIQPRRNHNERVEQLEKADSAGFGRARSRELGRVKHIKVDRDIDRDIPSGKQRCHLVERGANLAEAAERQWVHIGVSRRELKFAPLAAAYAELMYPAVADKVVYSPQHTGVRQLRTEVIVAQVGVRVEVDYVQVGILLV